MTGLSRRQFLHATAAAAAATGLGFDVLAPQLARAATPSADVPSTLLQTIRQGSILSGEYRTLTTGPGEPYLPRIDVLRRSPAPARPTAPRSLLYLGPLSDPPLIQAPSPGRPHAEDVLDHSPVVACLHPP